MNVQLTVEEARVLGCLIEKQLTTPEYYPLTLNALIAACNQKNNRDPLVSYDEGAVSAALDGLREKHLASIISTAGSRVPKFKHLFPETFGFDEKDVAILAELLLRGPQTPGELRNRSERMHAIPDLVTVETVLAELAARENGPFITKLPRQPGTKESRYTHLFCGAVTVQPSPAEFQISNLPSQISLSPSPSTLDRIAKLEADVTDLRNQFAEFRKQFE